MAEAQGDEQQAHSLLIGWAVLLGAFCQNALAGHAPVAWQQRVSPSRQDLMKAYRWIWAHIATSCHLYASRRRHFDSTRLATAGTMWYGAARGTAGRRIDQLGQKTCQQLSSDPPVRPARLFRRDCGSKCTGRSKVAFVSARMHTCTQHACTQQGATRARALHVLACLPKI